MKAKKLFLATAVLATAISFTLSCKGKKPVAYPEGAYIETGGGFVVVPPDTWIMADEPELIYKTFVSPSNSNTNVNFIISQNNRPLSDFIEYFINDLPSTRNLNIIGKEDFKTAKGLKGKKITAIKETITEKEEYKFRLSYYIIPNEKGLYMITVFATEDLSSEKYDTAFDKSMKTFEWIE
jgi:hypothetical protein